MTRAGWFDHWALHDQIDFFVAVGTVLLGVGTLAMVHANYALIAADDRRYGGSLAPLVRIQLLLDGARPTSMIGLEARNVGLGPALHIQVRAGFGAKHREHPPFEDRISALLVGETRAIQNSFTRAPRPPDRKFYGAVTVSYDDMFGNRYATIYTDFGLLSYRYVRPDGVHLH